MKRIATIFILLMILLMLASGAAWGVDNADTLLVTSTGNDWSLYSGTYTTSGPNLLTLHAGKYTSSAANMGFLFSWGNYASATAIDSVRVVVESVYAADSDILLKVAANDVTSASAPADSAAWIAMLAAPTTAQIDWDVSTSAGQPASVLITSVIEELFSTGGWDGSIALMIYDDGTVATYTSLSTRSYDYLTASPVKLIIYYQTSGETPANRSWYVNSASSGNNNGQDWTNAWETVDDIVWGGGSVAAGDTVWFGDGNYNNLVLSLAESAGALSYIIKASDSVHGTDAGWNSGYGDGQATFIPNGTTSAISVTTGNWVIDGAYRTDETSGHGIIVNVSESDTDAAGIFLDSSAAGMANVTVQYVEYDGPGSGLSSTSIGFRTDDSDDDFDHVTIRYCYLHDNSKVMMRIANCDSILIEYCFLADVWSGDGGVSHGGAISSYYGTDDLTIRYSKFRNIEGSSAIAAIHSSTGMGGCNHVRIYGNIAWYTPEWGGEQGYYDIGASAAVTNNLLNGDGASDWVVYNNTIVNIPYMNSGLEVRDPETDNNYSYNNLFYNNDANATMATWTDHDYNIAINTGQMWNWELNTNEVSVTGDSPFVDWENGDFTLLYDPLLVNGGYDVATALSVEATDPLGNEWGDDGYWDVGALEYQSEGTPYAPLAIPELTTDSKSTTGFVLSVAIPDSAIGVKVTAADDTTVVLYQSVFPDSLIEITGIEPDTEQSWRAAYYNGIGDGAYSEAHTDTTEAQVVTSITVSPSTASAQLGTPVTFTATVYDQDSGVMTEETVTWTATGGTIDEDTGVYDCDVPGLFTITATSDTDGEVEGTAVITVYTQESSAFDHIPPFGGSGKFTGQPDPYWREWQP